MLKQLPLSITTLDHYQTSEFSKHVRLPPSIKHINVNGNKVVWYGPCPHVLAITCSETLDVSSKTSFPNLLYISAWDIDDFRASSLRCLKALVLSASIDNDFWSCIASTIEIVRIRMSGDDLIDFTNHDDAPRSFPCLRSLEIHCIPREDDEETLEDMFTDLCLHLTDRDRFPVLTRFAFAVDKAGRDWPPLVPSDDDIPCDLISRDHPAYDSYPYDDVQLLDELFKDGPMGSADDIRKRVCGF
jgi:hypothetical protein